jgi:hypothetical protein
MSRLARTMHHEAKELVRLIDGSPLSLKGQRFSWAEADSRCRSLKLHMVYDPRAVAPVHFAVESPKVMCGRPLRCKEIFARSRPGRVQSCVRPVCAAT